MTTIYTIGHSRHTAERFAALLREQEIVRLVDVRSHPASRWAPQFGKAALAQMLGTKAIEYVFLGRELGGRPDGAEFFGADGVVDYERRAKSPDFRAGIERLVELARERATTILCAEEDPGRCHRRLLVAPALRRAGLTVVHIRGNGHLEPDDVARPSSPQLGLFQEKQR
jgi:uncharacterized protein (DUF488 family)